MIKHLLLSIFLAMPILSCKSAHLPIVADSYATSYEISMPQPNDHFFIVKVTINDPEVLKNQFVNFKMAAWTPGSYLIREYAKNVEGFEARSGGKTIKNEKTSKNTWSVSGHSGQPIEVTYRLYSFEVSVRTNFLDDSHGYFNGAPTFMYVPELMNKKALVKVIPHESFKTVSVALPEIAKNTFEVENFDLLVDSPFEVGNHEVLEFEALGVRHRIANYAMEALTYDKTQLIEDYKKVVLAAHSVVGGKHPCKEYLFIIHHLVGQGGGGLEHLNSTTCQTSPSAYKSAFGYQGFMGLLAHEYFHLWNVKRLRPVALGPFDYENENYTHMLWVAEGFTNYYQSDLLRRANLIDEDRMLASLAGNIGGVENQYGNKVQSVAESSWDAWIKYYRANENSQNSTISYYNKGGLLANILNMIIIGNTNGEKSLDNVLANLYNDLYLKQDVGYTDQQFFDECSKVAGENLNSFFEKYVFGTETIDYAKYFAMVDVDAKLVLANPGVSNFGATIRGGKVLRVDYGTGAYNDGINVGDEILAVDDKAFTTADAITSGKKIGDIVKITVLRNGVKRSYDITLLEDTRKRVVLTPKRSNDAIAQKKYKKWMHL